MAAMHDFISAGIVENSAFLSTKYS